jgi:hypothetical protein
MIFVPANPMPSNWALLKILPDTPMYDKAEAWATSGWDTPHIKFWHQIAEFCRSQPSDEYAHLLSLYWNKQEFVPNWLHCS